MDEGSAKGTPAPDDDDVLRAKAFGRARGMNLGAFMVDDAAVAEATDEVAADAEGSTAEGEASSRSAMTNGEPQRDAAVGDVGDLFSLAAPVDDGQRTPEDLGLVEAEQHLSRGLMVAMVLVWTAIGAVVGTVLPEVISAIGLVAMAAVGLALGQRWIQRPSMHLLGVTWVIIAMKLLYGLALDAWRWGWFDTAPLGAGETLGLVLLGLVGVNVGLAFYHDEDAIAAQSALVLFAVGSGAGAVYGEMGVAVVLVLAMALMHGLALARSSGNLASLGISISYLWVGVHALSNEWTVFSLTLLPLEDRFTLFLLLAAVTTANAAMAARFVDKPNWLSQAVSGLGLGKPGLWAVSVSLGMVGALMVIAAHRAETGYALAQLSMLALAFVASYLSVRGVAWPSMAPFILVPAPVLLAGLALLASGQFTVDWPGALSDYAVFAAATVAVVTGLLLRHQTDVSDHVLWLGALVVVTLLTLLIPADDAGSSARLLLVTQGAVWLGLGALAVQRRSPSMAGVAVLAPLAWLLIFATDVESRLVNADVLPISLGSTDVGVWMTLLMVQQVGVNRALGSAHLNLAGRFAGFSEISARLRDGASLNLWNLGFVLATVTFYGMARPDGLTAPWLLTGMGVLLVAHGVMVWTEVHAGRSRPLFIVWCIAAVALAWRFGDEASWAFLLLTGGFMLLQAEVRLHVREVEQRHHDPVGRMLTAMLAALTALLLVVGLDPTRTVSLVGQGWMSDALNAWALVAASGVLLATYLWRLPSTERLLPPTVGAVSIILAVAMVGQTLANPGVLFVALGMFVSVGAYLAFQGDVRSGLKALANREAREAAFNEKRANMEAWMATSSSSDGQTEVALKRVDAQLLALAETQRRRSKRQSVSDPNDLIVGDIHYRPVVMLLFLGVTAVVGAWTAYATALGWATLVFSTAFFVVLVGLSKARANAIGLRLPDAFGVELPIAVAMGGLTLIHVAGRMTVGVLDGSDATHQLVLVLGLVGLAWLGLFGRNDLGLRLPSALEAVLGLLVIDRLITVLIGGEVPLPLVTDPFDGSFLSWGFPIWGTEAVLVGMVLVFDWVERERLRRELDDHRGALGRSAWLGSAVILSVGLAGALVVLFGFLRARAWKQPAVVLVGLLALPFLVQSWQVWALVPLGLNLAPAEAALVLGVGCAVWSAWLVQTDRGLWLASGLWAMHLLAYGAGLTMGSLFVLTLVGIMASATAWIAGLLTLRTSWRVIGAIDLAVGWLFAAVLFVTGASATALLLMLVASAVLLFAVTLLTQSRQDLLAEA